MPPQRPQTRLPSRLPGLLGLWLALLLTAGLLGYAPAAEAASKAGASKKAGKKKSGGKHKKSSKHKKARAAPVRPLSRDVDGPTGVTSGGELEEEEGEGDLDDEDGTGGDAESELEAIERELLAQPVSPEPAVVELPPPVTDPTPIDARPRWVQHMVIPGDTLDAIAERYSVERKRVAAWNNIKGDKPALRSGRSLRIHAVNPPPPRERHEHVAKKGDTFESVAKANDVPLEQLKAWNRKLGKTLTSKEKVVFWREPPPLEHVEKGGLAAKLAQIRVPAGGISIGKPSRGRLVRGVALPDRPDLYTKRKPDESYGSTHAITQLMAAVTRFRHDTGFKRQVVIGGISRARGGRFRPHKSHQSGRDIDIRMPLLATAEGKRHTSPNDIDWKATWKLIHAFIATGEVEYVFLEYPLQKRLYKAAREAGATQEQLALWLQWPKKPSSTQGKKCLIRHVEGHRVHFHVRIRCGDGEKHCVTAR